MSTIIKPELSKKNPYYIPKYRFYELKNFCLQYSDWKKSLNQIDGFGSSQKIIFIDKQKTKVSSVENAVLLKDALQTRIDIIEKTAELTDKELSKWILKGVTSTVSYDYLYLNLGIPCSRDTYYRRYRMFFYILDKLRG